MEDLKVNWIQEYIVPERVAMRKNSKLEEREVYFDSEPFNGISYYGFVNCDTGITALWVHKIARDRFFLIDKYKSLDEAKAIAEKRLNNHVDFKDI